MKYLLYIFYISVLVIICTKIYSLDTMTMQRCRSTLLSVTFLVIKEIYFFSYISYVNTKKNVFERYSKSHVILSKQKLIKR